MEGKSYLLCRFASGHLLLNEAMEGYILIVLQVLITGLIIWRRKQDSKEPLGCLAVGLYGSDYQAAPPEAWIKKFRHTTPSLVFIVFALMLILINWLVWKSAVSRMTPKDEGTEAALALLATRKPFTVRTLLGLCWLVPVWPAILGIACWYFGIQKQKTFRRSRTCPKCNRETLREIPLHELVKDTKRLIESERKETELKTAYIRIYRCSACSEEVKRTAMNAAPPVGT